MSYENFQQLMAVIPDASQKPGAIPEPFTVLRYPNILMENDGFPSEVVWTLDSFYMHLANILGNLGRVKADGIEMHVSINPETSKPKIELQLLIDQGNSLNSAFTEKIEQPNEILYRPTKIGYLQTHPEAWSYSNTSGEVEIAFVPVNAKPMGRVTENSRSGHVFIAYGSQQTKDVVQYAAGKQGGRKIPLEKNVLLDPEKINSALKEAIREITKKLSELKDDGELF